MKIVSLLLAACSSRSSPEQAPSAALKQLKWPSFDNIHKAVSFSPQSLSASVGKFPLDQEVLVLEKLDGTNLGLEIDVDSGTLVAVFGRKAILWNKTDDDESDPFDLSYIAKGTLHPLKKHIPRLEQLAKTLVARIAAAAEDDDPRSCFTGNGFNQRMNCLLPTGTHTAIDFVLPAAMMTTLSNTIFRP